LLSFDNSFVVDMEEKGWWNSPFMAQLFQLQYCRIFF
jgi:hypothetical protein